MNRHSRTTGVDVFQSSPAADRTTMVCSGLTGDSGKYLRLDNLFQSESWPVSTDLSCWHCAHGFEGPPCAVPAGHDVRSGVFSVYGCFCSWGCVKRWMLDRPDHEVAMRFVLLQQLAFRMGHRGEIIPNPPTTTLRDFGGPLTVEEFRATGARGPVEVVEVPFISFPQVMSSDQSVVQNDPGRRDVNDTRGLRRPTRPEPAPPQPPPTTDLYTSFVNRRREESTQRKRQRTSEKDAPREPSEPSPSAATTSRRASTKNQAVEDSPTATQSLRRSTRKRGTLLGFVDGGSEGGSA